MKKYIAEYTYSTGKGKNVRLTTDWRIIDLDCPESAAPFYAMRALQSAGVTGLMTLEVSPWAGK